MEDLMPSTADGGVSESSKSDFEKKKAKLGSLISHWEWTAEEYDRKRGQGAFFKKYPETKQMLNKLYEEKVECMQQNTLEILKEM